MKKEVLIAVVLGIAVGLVITFGMVRARKAVQEGLPLASSLLSATPLPSSTPDQENASDKIRLTEPASELLTDQPTTRVSGQTTPNATIAIVLLRSEVLTTSDQNGNFSVVVPLETGSNVLTVRLLEDNGQQTEIIRTVIYSTADLTTQSTASTSATPVATRSATRSTPTPKPTVKPTIKP